MLQNLNIQNYALIESLSIDFEMGFNAITGETGAGKSILLGALGLITGNRADKTVVRRGAKKCVVEAEFDTSKTKLTYLFEKHDLDQDESCIVRREVNENGKSRAFINDTPVTLVVLKEFGDRLIDIHSQHENLLISDSQFQLKTIDLYAGANDQLRKFQTHYLSHQGILKELKTLKELNEKAKSDQDYYQFLFNELEEANVKDNELVDLENELQLLESSEDLAVVMQQGVNLISESEENVVNQLQRLSNDISKFSGINNELDNLIQRLKEVEIELSDLGDSFQSVGSSLDFDEERKSIISDRVDLLNTLLVKHRVNSCSELIEIYNDLSDKLGDLDSLDEKILELEKELESSGAELKKRGDSLSNIRQKSFKSFEKEVKSILSKIGMPCGEVVVAHDMLNEASEFGYDKIVFLFSANKGEEPKSIGKIASGGEISRLMLALKSITAKKSTLPSIVFDEIDAGISGEVAGKVGELMKSMADNLQLLTISHLPQIASKGNAHYKVKKLEGREGTKSIISRLTESERVQEIAAMLSGAEISEAALENAKSLLN